MRQSIQISLAKLKAVGKSGTGWMAECPAHVDRHPSLSVSEGQDGRVLIHCHAGCPPENVVAAIGLTIADLAPPTESAGGGSTTSGAARRIVVAYDCRDERGDVLFQVVRFEPKDFKQRRPDGQGGWRWSVKGVRRVPYRLPELLEADPTELVFVVEGEKDVDHLAGLGLVATCNPGGAGKWPADFARHLRGRHVAILPDNDEPGRTHAERVARTVQSAVAAVRIVHLPGVPDHGDISDWLNAGGTIEQLLEVVQKTPEWEPPSAAARPVLVRLADVKPRPVEWLWPGRVARGKLTLIVGNPDVGKSLVTLDLAARISMGMCWPGIPRTASPTGSVVLLSAEDDLDDTVRPRLDAAGADVARIVALRSVQRWDLESGGPIVQPFSLGRDLPALEQAIGRTGQVRLVVIDPVSAYLGKCDSHNNSEVRALLAPLAELANRHRVAVIGVTHLNKSARGSALYRVMGSLAFVAAARPVWLVGKDKEDPARRLMVSVKNNLAADLPGLAYTIGDNGDGHPVLEWSSAPVFATADDLLGADNDEQAKGAAIREAVNWLVDALSDGPVPATEIKARAKSDGIAPRTLDRAKEQLQVIAERVGFGPGSKWIWRLPDRSAPDQAIERQTHAVAHNGDLGALQEEPASEDLDEVVEWTA